MPATPAWDRAAALPVPADPRERAARARAARARAEIVALRDEFPTVGDLFTFMRDAELRFATLRMRIDVRTATTQGEKVEVIEVTLRHPGEVKVLTLPVGGAIGAYDAWVSDGETVRTYTASRKLGTRRPVRKGIRGLDNGDLPGASRVYVPRTDLQPESLPDVFLHPAGYCQNVLATGDGVITGVTRVAGREAIVLECTNPRTIERVADRADFLIRIAVDRADGVILRLEESMGDLVTRFAEVASYEPDAVLAPGAFAFTFPVGTVFIY
jgi:outer membrane lipoprotein-sorting protein